MNSVRIKRRSKQQPAPGPGGPAVTTATPKTGAKAKGPTKWGDREQRRVDILDAARTRIAADARSRIESER